jgi:hypothetical protein
VTRAHVPRQVDPRRVVAVAMRLQEAVLDEDEHWLVVDGAEVGHRNSALLQVSS